MNTPECLPMKYSFDRIFAAIVTGPTKEKFINLVADHANKAIVMQ